MAYKDAPATCDATTIIDAINAVDAQVEQASAEWLAALPQEFATNSTTEQQRTLIAVVVAARNGIY